MNSYLKTALIAVVAIAIVNRVSALQHVVYGTNA